jgi:hypothetical protein
MDRLTPFRVLVMDGLMLVLLGRTPQDTLHLLLRKTAFKEAKAKSLDTPEWFPALVLKEWCVHHVVMKSTRRSSITN